jgi:hypothetical protein
MLQDFYCPADVGVGGDMPVMSMVDKTYMYIRSLKRETRQVFPDCYGKHEKPMPVSKLTCGKFPVARRGMTANPADMLWVMTRYLSSIWNKSYLGLVVWFQL